MEFGENPGYGRFARLAINRLAYAIEHYRYQHRLCAEVGLVFNPHPDQANEAAYRRVATMFHAPNAVQQLVEALHVLRYANGLSWKADYIALVRDIAHVLYHF